jgi:hypothetical protein
MDWKKRIKTFYASSSAPYHIAGTQMKLDPGTYTYAYIEGITEMPPSLYRPFDSHSRSPEELKADWDAIYATFEDSGLQSVNQHLEEMYGHWRPIWHKIGMENYWIGRAWDPTFDGKHIYLCESIDEMMTLLIHGNWSTGTAFAYQDQCWINQVNGGDEWRVIKGAYSFDSVTASAVAREKECPLFIKGISGSNRLGTMIFKIASFTEAEIRAGADYSPDEGY